MRQLLQKALLRNRSKLFLQVNMFLGSVAVLSVITICLETVAALAVYGPVFDYLEYFSVSVFTVELLARLYAKDDRLGYLFSFYGAVDILAILPTYVGLTNLTFIKSARIFRVLSFLRMSRLSKLARLNKYSNRNSRRAVEIQFLTLRIYGIVFLVMVMVFGTLLYVIEGNNPLFKDVPSSILWVSMILLGTTIDPTQLSFLAKLLLVAIQFSSLLLFGLLIAIVGRFVERQLLGSESLD